MLICFLLPLLISWIFKRTGSKRVYLTYLFSGTFIILLAALNVFTKSIQDPETDNPYLIMLPVKTLISMLGSALILLFMTLFFQYIFNKTMGLKS